MRINVGSIGLADSESKVGYTSPDYVVFSCRNGLKPTFLLYFLKSSRGLREISKNCSGAVRKRLYYSDLINIELPINSIDDQDHIIEKIIMIKKLQVEIENSKRYANQLLEAMLNEAFR